MVWTPMVKPTAHRKMINTNIDLDAFYSTETPEMWEARISQLLSQGELEQAEAELEKLQQRYPDYSINTSILEQLY